MMMMMICGETQMMKGALDLGSTTYQLTGSGVEAGEAGFNFVAAPEKHTAAVNRKLRVKRSFTHEGALVLFIIVCVTGTFGRST